MWGRATVLAVLGVAAVGGANAHAAAVTIGSPLTTSFTDEPVGDPATLLNSALGEPGAVLTAPFFGRVVRWRIRGAGTFRLRVLRPLSDGGYQPDAVSDPVVVSGPTTVPASMPIAAGEVVAVESAGLDDEIGIATVDGSVLDSWVPPLTTTRTPDGRELDIEAAYNADVLRPPALASLSHAPAGPEGGTHVVIAGTELGETSSVTFGSTPAASFTIDSDTQVTAVSPPQGADRSVTLHLTTPAGTAAMRFGYTAPPRVPQPLPAPAPATFTVVRRPAATHSGVRLRVACSGPVSGKCILSARLGARRHGSRLPVGATYVVVDAGKTVTVDAKLNPTGRRLLARLRRLPVTFTARAKASGRPWATLAPRTLVLRAAKRR